MEPMSVNEGSSFLTLKTLFNSKSGNMWSFVTDFTGGSKGNAAGAPLKGSRIFRFDTAHREILDPPLRLDSTKMVSRF